MIGTLWFSVVVLCLVMYVVLDGYDLGIGMNLLFERDRDRQREMVEIVATAWDGNETWLILLGVSLWGGFPLAYGIVLPHLFLLLVVMLFALIVRGVSIEAISGSDDTPPRWIVGFSVGSLVAAFAQGMIFGALTESVPVVHGAYAGSALDVISPFTILTGFAVALAYAVLGAGFVRIKTEGALRQAVSSRGRVLLAFATFVALITALSIDATAAPIRFDTLARGGTVALLMLLALGAVVTAFATFRRTRAGNAGETMPFVAVTTAVVAGLLALVVGRYPTILPPHLTIESAQSPRQSLDFLLIGVGSNIPLVLFYSWFAHHVFRGKYRTTKQTRLPGTSAVSQALSPAVSTEENR
jgi:cytochrome d ubiquinol oxidase subunit II